MKDKIYIFVDKRKWRRMLMSFLGKHIYNEFSSFRPCDYYLVAAHTWRRVTQRKDSWNYKN